MLLSEFICGDAQGTNKGYQRHKTAGDTPCAECRADAARYERERRWKHGMNVPLRPAKHGTNSGYIRHVKNRETSCAPCRRAHRDYMQRWRNGSYKDRPSVSQSIVDVLTTHDRWMPAGGLEDFVCELHPEWARRSVSRVLMRLVEAGVVKSRRTAFGAEYRAYEEAWELVS